ncbi:MAG TPA: transcriptional repressor [Anaeromyxobacteraceae bacterium]|nr:transcriptional repressor [Anaeromyxobacteraceae bacterium]
MTPRNHRPTSKNALDSTAEAKARVARHLARAGLKRSRTRDAVVDTFLETAGHLSAEELTTLVRRRAPGVGFTTVYRALKLLQDCGLATASQFRDGHAHYERVLEGAHHDHLVCTECGEITEFENPEIERLQEEVGRQHGFEVTSHRTELYGRCARCVVGFREPSPTKRAS